MRIHPHFALAALVWSSRAGDGGAFYYPEPGVAWESRTPAEVGMYPELLEAGNDR